jgi:hypothetical protein
MEEWDEWLVAQQSWFPTPEVSMQLQAPLLGIKLALSPASEHTQEQGVTHSPPNTWLGEMSGTPVPLCKQVPWLPLLHRYQKAQASRNGSPRSSTLELSSLRPMQEVGPQNFHCPRALLSWACSSAIGLWSLMPLWEIRPENSHHLQAWFSQTSCSTTEPAAPTGNQAPKLPQPMGFVLLCLQQLPWFLEVQVDPRASAALWAPDDSSLVAFLVHR